MSLKSTLDALAERLPNWSKQGLNEAQTSQVIVLQVLQALGYDIWDPYEVNAQTHSGGGSGANAPDFVVQVDGLSVRQRFVLEVKALRQKIDVNGVNQAVSYVSISGCRWAVLTNGSEWQFFDNQISKPAAEKLVLTVELKDPRAADYLSRLLSRQVWSTPGAEASVATASEAVAREIRKHLKLSEIEDKLREEMKSGLTCDREGLVKAMRLALEPNERELAEEAFEELVKRLLTTDAPPPLAFSEPMVLPSSSKPLDACSAIVEGMRSTVPNRRASRSAEPELRAWLGDIELPATNWRDINAGLVEAMLKLGQKAFVMQKGYIYKSPQARLKRNGELYPPSAYRRLSDGDFLFLHDGASGHMQKSRRMLKELRVAPQSLRVLYRGEDFFLP